MPLAAAANADPFESTNSTYTVGERRANGSVLGKEVVDPRLVPDSALSIDKPPRSNASRRAHSHSAASRVGTRKTPNGIQRQSSTPTAKHPKIEESAEASLPPPSSSATTTSTTTTTDGPAAIRRWAQRLHVHHSLYAPTPSAVMPVNGMIKTYDSQHRTFQRPHSAKTVFFYKDGDIYYTGLRVPVSKVRYRTIGSLLDTLSQQISLPFGVRHLHTPYGRTPITSLDQLEHLGRYVASSSRHAKGVDMEALERRRRERDAALRYRGYRSEQSFDYTSSSNRSFRARLTRVPATAAAAPSATTASIRQRYGSDFYPSTAKQIFFVLNGRPSQIYRCLLNPSRRLDFDSLLQEVSEALEVAIFKLYSYTGSRITTMPELFDLKDSRVLAVPRHERLILQGRSYTDLRNVTEMGAAPTPGLPPIRRRADRDPSAGSSSGGNGKYGAASRRYVAQRPSQNNSNSIERRVPQPILPTAPLPPSNTQTKTGIGRRKYVSSLATAKQNRNGKPADNRHFPRLAGNNEKTTGPLSSTRIPEPTVTGTTTTLHSWSRDSSAAAAVQRRHSSWTPVAPASGRPPPPNGVFSSTNTADSDSGRPRSLNDFSNGHTDNNLVTTEETIDDNDEEEEEEEIDEEEEADGDDELEEDDEDDYPLQPRELRGIPYSAAGRAATAGEGEEPRPTRSASPPIEADESLVEAATRIQAATRGFLARKRIKKKSRPNSANAEMRLWKEEGEGEAMDAAATRIQAATRGYLARRQMRRPKRADTVAALDGNAHHRQPTPPTSLPPSGRSSQRRFSVQSHESKKSRAIAAEGISRAASPPTRVATHRSTGRSHRSSGLNEEEDDAEEELNRMEVEREEEEERIRSAKSARRESITVATRDGVLEIVGERSARSVDGTLMADILRPDSSHPTDSRESAEFDGNRRESAAKAELLDESGTPADGLVETSDLIPNDDQNEDPMANRSRPTTKGSQKSNNHSHSQTPQPLIPIPNSTDLPPSPPHDGVLLKPELHARQLDSSASALIIESVIPPAEEDEDLEIAELKRQSIDDGRRDGVGALRTESDFTSEEDEDDVLAKRTHGPLDVDSYSVTVKLGNRWAADSETELYITMIGDKKEAEKFYMRQKYVNWLESDHTNYVQQLSDTFQMQIECGFLGIIRRLVVGHDSHGYGAGIFIDRIIITEDAVNGRAYLFQCHKWLDSGQVDGKLERVLRLTACCDMDPIPHAMQRLTAGRWEVVLHSGDAKGQGGTTSNLRLVGFGTRGSAEVVLKNEKELREVPSKSLIQCHFEGIGELLKLRVEVDGEGDQPDYFLDAVELRDLDTQDRCVVACGKWLRFESTKKGEQPFREILTFRLGAEPLPLLVYDCRLRIVPPSIECAASNIRVELVGDMGETGVVPLDIIEATEKNGRLELNFKIEAVSIGKLSYARIYLDLTPIGQHIYMGFAVLQKVWDFRNEESSRLTPLGTTGNDWLFGPMYVREGLHTPYRYVLDASRIRPRATEEEPYIKELRRSALEGCSTRLSIKKKKSNIQAATWQLSMSIGADSRLLPLVYLCGETDTAQMSVVSDRPTDNLLNFHLRDSDLGSICKVRLRTDDVVRLVRDEELAESGGDEERLEEKAAILRVKKMRLCDTANGDEIRFPSADVEMEADAVVEFPAFWPDRPPLPNLVYEAHVVTGASTLTAEGTTLWLNIYGEFGDVSYRKLELLVDEPEQPLFSTESNCTFEFEAVSIGLLKTAEITVETVTPEFLWECAELIIGGSLSGESYVFSFQRPFTAQNNRQNASVDSVIFS